MSTKSEQAAPAKFGSDLKSPAECDAALDDLQNQLNARKRKFDEDKLALESAYCGEKDVLETKVRQVTRRKQELGS